MGESILEEPANRNVVVIVLRLRPTVCREIAARTQRLTEDTMPLQRAGLRQIGDDAHTVSSLPAIVAAQIWITVVRIMKMSRH